MSEFAKEVFPANLEDEMRQSYLDYAMSVIIGRALPDVRDGLKPVHRRALYAMHELNNNWNAAYKKSARIVGDVIGKYHPHGDTAVYDTIVRMAQPFSLRYMLVDGQGNFGSIDGDNAAAMRYTEIRMAKIAHQLLEDIDKETVDFIANYDGSEHEPSVFPTRIPNLLVNGASGIAVGMATNIPPHNLSEIVDACVQIIDDPDTDTDTLIRLIPGPDFPTGAIINGTEGIKEAYRTGRGRVIMRSRTHIETDEKTGRQAIIVTELPYQINKARMIEKISELVKEKRIDGISTLRDESDKDGIRVYIEVRRGEVPEVILNNLFQLTPLQSSYGINMVALNDGQPRVMNLKEVLDAFLRHRREVVTRRTIYLLRKARERAHILEGLAIALENIDPIIQLIKDAPSPSEAKEALLSQSWEPGLVLDMLSRTGAEASRPEELEAHFGMGDGQYRLSPHQAQAILDMRLQKLTGLEQDKIIDEYREILDKIADLIEILTLPERLMNVIRDELIEVKAQFGDARRSEILEHRVDLTMEDLITEEDMVVTLSHEGYIKTQQLSAYRAQRRGGRGKSATSMKNEDFIESLFIANTHDTLLCFSSRGQVYWLKVYELPSAGRQSRGKPIINLLPLESEERINAILPIREYDENYFITFVTAKGVVKKTKLEDYARRRASGLIAINLDEDDYLIRVMLTDGTQDIMLVSDAGKACRFHEDEVRVVGRGARGVRGINLADDQSVVAAIALREQDNECNILTVSENGFGKRTAAAQFPRRSRGTKGVIAMQTSERNGPLIGAAWVSEYDEVMLISDQGTLVRTRVSEISQVSRNTQGVNVIRLDKGERLIGMARILNEADPDEEIAEDMAESMANGALSSEDQSTDDGPAGSKADDQELDQE